MKIGEGALFYKKGTKYMSILEPKFDDGEYFAPHENHCKIVHSCKVLLHVFG